MLQVQTTVSFVHLCWSAVCSFHVAALQTSMKQTGARLTPIKVDAINAVEKSLFYVLKILLLRLYVAVGISRI